MDPRIKAALEMIGENLQEAFTVEQLATRAGLSRSRFEYLFGRETGLSFKSYLRSMRLADVRKLLSDPTLSIKQVAFAVGYHYTPNFTRDFKRHFGKTPSQYRSEGVATLSNKK